MNRLIVYLIVFTVGAAITLTIINNPEPLLNNGDEAFEFDSTLVEVIKVDESPDEPDESEDAVVAKTGADKDEDKEIEPAESSSEQDESREQGVIESAPETEAEGNDSSSSNEADTGPQTPVVTGDCQSMIDASPFYWESEMQAARKENELRASGNDDDADLLQAISCTPQATWILGDNQGVAGGKVERAVGKANGKIPVFVIYNAPQHSSLAWGTGIGNGDAYLAWVATIADKIGNSDAWIIIEPDAIPLSHNLSPANREIRHAEIRGAVELFKEEAPNARIYLDAGHNVWKIADRMSEYLDAAGIDKADGFSLNVSNYQLLSDEINYGKEISDLTGGKHYIIDTSRNGNGPAGPYDWCNASGRAIGRAPTTDTDNSLIDAFLWIKLPGESDGMCNGGPPPGRFWLDYALDLIREAA